VVLLELSFSNRGQGLWRLGERAAGSLASRKGWNWLALFALTVLYALACLSPSAALIQRFFPHVWLWGTSFREAVQAIRFLPERLSLPLPPPLSPLTMEHAHIVPSTRLEEPGWRLSPDVFPAPFSQSLESDQPEVLYTYLFTVQAVGVYWRKAPDAGQVAWSIDGSAEQMVDAWSAVEQSSYLILGWGLPPGKHELRLRVIPSQNTASSGKWIRILGMLLGE
jgi:hypothetical protein